MADTKVLVVGAGLAGLLVAYRLRQAGVAVDVMEACDRIGGRILSQADALGTGLVAELGGEAFDSDHAACLALAAELGLGVSDLQATLPLPDRYYFGGQMLDPQTLAAELRAVPWEADLSAARQFFATGQPTPAVVALDRQNICEYVAAKGMSAALQAVIRAAYTAKYGLEAEAQSSLNLLHFLQDNSLNTTEFNLFGRSDERYFIAGGNDQLPRRLGDAVADAIETGTALTALRQTPAGRYRVSWEGGCDRNYDYVVLTLPFNLLRQMPLQVPLPPRQRQAIDQLGYNRPVKTITAYRQRPWRTARLSPVVYSDCPWQHVWETSASAASDGPAGLLTNYSSAEPLEAAALVRQLEPCFPGLGAAHQPGALVSPWLTNAYSQGAYSCYRVGQWCQFYGWEGRASGQLYFAGEHCSRDYQGYMEGAAETAEATALALLRRLQPQAAAGQQRRIEEQRRRRLSTPQTHP